MIAEKLFSCYTGDMQFDKEPAPSAFDTFHLDSECGTLLNFADQILKSWSHHGQVEYYASPYRRPENSPFGEESASGFLR
jgi:hypothetical protein